MGKFKTLNYVLSDMDTIPIRELLLETIAQANAASTSAKAALETLDNFLIETAKKEVKKDENS